MILHLIDGEVMELRFGAALMGLSIVAVTLQPKDIKHLSELSPSGRLEAMDYFANMVTKVPLKLLRYDVMHKDDGVFDANDITFTPASE